MKSIFLASAFAVCFTFSAKSQWNTVGVSDITNSNSGNVGIGTSTPVSKLTVQGPGISLTNFTITLARAGIFVSPYHVNNISNVSELIR